MMKLKLECIPGAEIGKASREAQRVSNMLGIDVEFEFNGVRCLARPSGDHLGLAERQQAEQAREPTGPLDARKFAQSYPPRGKTHD